MDVQPWFYRSDDDWNAIVEQLKLTPCPHCKAVGTLMRHGSLYGFDDSRPQRQTLRAPHLLQQPQRAARLRTHRQRLARRHHPPLLPLCRHALALPAMRRRPRHRHGHARLHRSATEPASAFGNASFYAKVASAPTCRHAAHRQNCQHYPHVSRRRRKPSLISRPPSPTRIRPSLPSNRRYTPSSCKSMPASTSIPPTVFRWPHVHCGLPDGHASPALSNRPMLMRLPLFACASLSTIRDAPVSVGTSSKPSRPLSPKYLTIW